LAGHAGHISKQTRLVNASGSVSFLAARRSRARCRQRTIDQPCGCPRRRSRLRRLESSGGTRRTRRSRQFRHRFRNLGQDGRHLFPSSSGANAVQDAVRTIQAAGDDVVINTASENGLVVAKNHFDPAINPSGARPNSTKVVIFLSGIFLSVPFRSRGEEKTPTEKCRTGISRARNRDAPNCRAYAGIARAQMEPLESQVVSRRYQRGTPVSTNEETAANRLDQVPVENVPIENVPSESAPVPNAPDRRGPGRHGSRRRDSPRN